MMDRPTDLVDFIGSILWDDRQADRQTDRRTDRKTW